MKHNVFGCCILLNSLHILYSSSSWFVTLFLNKCKIVLFLFLFFFWLCGMWDLSSPTRDRTRTPYSGSAAS